MNPGKIFEQEFKESVNKFNKENNIIYLLRLTDSASGFGMDSSKVRFSAKSPFDFLLHIKYGITVAVELKSTSGTSISFSLVDEDKMIKASQIKNLEKTEFYGIKSGFLLNFRKYEKTYFLPISKFLDFANITEKKSINLEDVISYGGVEIPSTKKRTKFLYDIKGLLE